MKINKTGKILNMLCFLLEMNHEYVIFSYSVIIIVICINFKFTRHLNRIINFVFPTLPDTTS